MTEPRPSATEPAPAPHQSRPAAAQAGVAERTSGGRRSRWRWLAPLLAAVALVAATAVVAGLSTGTAVTEVGRPATFGRQYPWQATYQQRPNGPAVAIMTSDETIYFESTGVLVGRDGSYRLYPLNPGESIGLIAPDGRRLARLGELLDLTGAPTRPYAGTPLAWAADGQQLLLAVDKSEHPITYGPDGPIEPSQVDQLRLYDVASGRSTPIADLEIGATQLGAISPDGRQVAVMVTDHLELRQLVIIDVAQRRVTRTVDLADESLLAGQAAWTPDSGAVLLLAAEGCAWDGCVSGLRGWHLQHVDPRTGQVTDEPARGRAGWPHAVTGWRGSDPLVVIRDQVIDVPGRPVSNEPPPPRLELARPDGTAEVLLTAADGVRGLDVPRDLAERGRLPSATANPFAAQPWTYGCLLAVVLVLLGAGWLIRPQSRRGRG